MRTISIRLDDSTDAVLTAYCKQHGLTQTGALKAAIQCLADAPRKPTPAQLAASLGLIGAAGGGTKDLGLHHSRHVKQKLKARMKRDSLASSAG